MFTRFRTPPQQHETKFQLGGAGEIHVRRQRFHFGVDADAGKKLCQCLYHTGVIDVAIVWTMQGHGEPVRVACLGQELFGAFRIEPGRLQFLAGAVEKIWQQLGSGDAFFFHYPINDRIAVDRHRQGLAHARVAKRVFIQWLAVLARHKRGRFVGTLVQVHVNHAVGDLVDQ